MSFPVKIVGITTKRNFEEHADFLSFFVHQLQKRNIQVCLSQHACIALKNDMHKNCCEIDYSQHIDLFFDFGGDGTILRTVRQLQDFDTPLLGINFGTLGFLSEIRPGEVEKHLDEILDGKISIDERTLLDVTIQKKSKKKEHYRVLNEIVISQGSIARLMRVCTQIGGRRVTSYRADGLIVATPTGSTAYSLSAGGPIVYPSIPSLILTPIAPHSFTQKPIIIPDDRKIELFPQFSQESTILTLDGQRTVTLDDGDIVVVEKSKETVKFARLKGEHFFKTIRGKLKWGEEL